MYSDSLSNTSDNVASYRSYDSDVSYGSLTHGSDSPILFAKDVGMRGGAKRKGAKKKTKGAKKSKNIIGNRPLKRSAALVQDTAESFSAESLYQTVSSSEGGAYEAAYDAASQGRNYADDDDEFGDDDDDFDMAQNTINTEAQSNHANATGMMNLFRDFPPSAMRPAPQPTNQMNHQQGPPNPAQNSILSKLPDNFSGALPDHLQHMMGAPGAGAGTNDAQQMMQQQIQQQIQQGPQAQHQMNSLPMATDMEPMQQLSQQQGNSLPSATAAGFNQMQSLPAATDAAPSGVQSGMLPEHLMMSQNSATQGVPGFSQEQIGHLGSAAMDGFNPASVGQQGGARDLDFFFLTSEVEQKE